MRWWVGVFAVGWAAAVAQVAPSQKDGPPPSPKDTPLLREAMEAAREGRLEDARTLLLTLLQSDPSNAAARAQLHILTTRLQRAEAQRRQLSQVVLPTVRLEDASAREAFDYLAQVIQKARPGLRLNTVWMVPPEHPGRVSLQLDNIPASEALRYAAEAAGLRIEFEEHAVKIRPAAQAAP